MFLKRLFYVLIITSTSLVQADDLTPLEVESSLLSNTVGESKYPLSVVGSKDIISTQSIGTIIKRIPGISNSDYGAAVGQPVIRGLGGNRVKVLSDNDNVNDLSHISADHPNMVNTSNASHIEVIKGPASIFNYSGTTGGIVNVITGSITDQAYSEEMIRLGRTYDTVSEGYSNNILMKRNIGNLSVYFSHNKRDYFNYDMSEGSLYEEGAEKHTLANSDFADKNLIAGEDYEAWIRLSKITEKFGRIDEPLGFYWAGGGNLSEAGRTVKFLTTIKGLHTSSLRSKPGLLSYQLARGHLQCNDLVAASNNLRDALTSKLTAIVWVKAWVTMIQLKVKLLFTRLTL